VLYSLSYAIRMSPKQGVAPEGYVEYSVYPLEGVWDISDEAKKNGAGRLDKNTLVFDIMIRQPDFVSAEYARQTLERVKRKKPHPLLDSVRFEVMTEGRCVHMLHVGAFDAEPESFAEMERFASGLNLRRVSLTHREIYLSDPGRVVPEKLRTVLRFQVV